MIHDSTEKMIYFEDARLEFFGKPVAYMPYFSAPDPTVKRKSGFLMPFVSSSTTNGFGVEIPYYWALAPDYDFTFSPRLMTRQGVLMRGEFRQRLIDGAYSIRASGIYQLDKEAYLRADGIAHSRLSGLPRQHRNHRTVCAERQMDLGLGRHPADRPDVFPELRLEDLPARHQHPRQRPDRGRVAALSRRPRRPQLFRYARDLLLRLFRSRLAEPNSASSIRWSITATCSASRCSAANSAIRANLTSLSRANADFNPISSAAYTNGLCALITRRPGRAKSPPTACSAAFRAPTPASPERRSGSAASPIPIGQIFTPFVKLRADAAAISIDQRSRRCQLHRARRQHRVPRHADGRSGVPLSVHQRATLGHPDHRADRASHRAAG